MITRQCLKCEQVLPIETFGFGGNPPHRYRQNTCRSCMQEWNNLPEQEREAIKAKKHLLIKTRTEKTCPQCKILLDIGRFFKCKYNVDGRAAHCKKCEAENREKRHKNRIVQRQTSTEETRKCLECGVIKPLANFNRRLATRGGIDIRCALCRSVQWRKQATDPEIRARYLYQRLKSKCIKLDIPFNLDRSDLVIPAKCPVLGMPLVFAGQKNKDTSPSVDRIVPSLGYTKGNVIITSFRANRIKSDATVEELKTITDFYAKLLDN